MKTDKKSLILKAKCMMVAITLLVLAGFANVFFAQKPADAMPSTTPLTIFARNVTLGDCNKSFLTFRPWFNGLCIEGGEGVVGTIASPNDVGGLPTFIWIIVLNILAILIQLVGYLSVGFIIWGGFQYILAQGEPDKLASAKKTITNAIIGLVLAIFSTVIINTIINFIGGGF